MMDHLSDQLSSWPMSFQAIAGATVLGLVFYLFTGHRPYAGFPVIKPDATGLAAWKPLRFAFMVNAGDLLAKGKQMTKNGFFQVCAGPGYKIIVPSRFADELRNHENLSLNMCTKKDFHADLPGFESLREGMRDDQLMPDVVRTRLTQSLGLVTDEIVDEAAYAIDKWFGDATEWKTHQIKPTLADVVARVSTRVFAGQYVARSEEFLEIIKDNAIDSFVAAQILHSIPRILRPVVHWVLPPCRNLRNQVARARSLFSPVIQQRLAGKHESARSGRAGDAFTWMEQAAKGRPIDYVAGQLNLSLGAIHTTTEVTTRCLIKFCEYPNIVPDLRAEMITVLRSDGWAKTSLYKMKLLDSFLKEVSRFSRMSYTTMGRYVKAPTTLSDGTVLPAGSLIQTWDDQPLDASVYPDPQVFDHHRYLKLRQQPGHENAHQFVALSTDNMLFGHGHYACPGRFFASNEIKILLCFLLLKYDWRFEPGYVRPKELEFESAITTANSMEVQARRREEEIDLLEPKEE